MAGNNLLIVWGYFSLTMEGKWENVLSCYRARNVQKKSGASPWNWSYHFFKSLAVELVCCIANNRFKPELNSFGQFQYEITYWILASSFGEERSFHTCTTIENAGAICWEGMNDDFFTNWMKIADLVLLASVEVHSFLSKCTRKLPQISSYAPRRFDRQPFTRNKQQS